MKYSIGYAIFVGVLLILQWTLLFLSGSVPEFETEPWAIAFHLTAEMGMAAVLLVGAVAALRHKPWATSVLLVGMGMVIYSAVNSPGYYAQLGQWGFVLMFTAVLAAAVLAVKKLLPKPQRHRHRRRH